MLEVLTRAAWNVAMSMFAAAAVFGSATTVNATAAQGFRGSSFSVSDPLAVGSWSLTQIKAREAWLSAPTIGAPVTVAILDAGISTTHEDLASQLWDNPADPANGVDDDENGVIDDTHGIAFKDGNGSSDLHDSDGHGTRVAGIIGAAANNGIGLAGLAPSAKLMVVKVTGPDGAGEIDILNGIQYAISHGARIINVSLGINTERLSEGLQAVLDLAEAHDVLVVAAAGNSSSNNDVSPVFPASSGTPAVIAVAASDQAGAKAGFSNWGAASVDLAAPGDGVMSTLNPDGYGEVRGTSMAVPHVTGVAAFLMAQRPTLTLGQVRSAILSSVHRSSAWTGLTTTGGLLDMQSALISALALPEADPANIEAPSLGRQLHRVGEPWSCSPGLWNAPTSFFEYRWKLNAVVAASTQTITPTDVQDGMRVECEVTGINSTGAKVVSTPAVSWVGPRRPRIDSVSISPKPLAGSVVKCVPKGFGSQFSSNWTIDGTPVDTALSFRVPDSAIGKVLGCSTALVNRISEVSDEMGASDTVKWPKPKATTQPRISGSKAGRAIKCTVTWKYRTSSSFAWLRDGRPVAGRKEILRTSSRDRRHRFTCVAKAVGPGGIATVSSRALRLR